MFIRSDTLKKQSIFEIVINLFYETTVSAKKYMYLPCRTVQQLGLDSDLFPLASIVGNSGVSCQ